MRNDLGITRVPAVYIGKQEGFRSIPALELYNLLAPMGDHPAGSTVARTTLEKHGWHLSGRSPRVGTQPLAQRRVCNESELALAVA